MITIYHNSRCSKSRSALLLAEKFAMEKQLPLQVVDYLATPLSSEQIMALQRQLGIALRDMVRETEPQYAELGLAQADDAALLRALCDHPKLLQRPIVTYRGRAVIGRPPERLSELLI